MSGKKNKDEFGINIMQYCRDHEAYIEAQLSLGADPGELLLWHEKKLSWLQHERLIHLLVTILTAGVFLFLVFMEYKLENYTVLFLLAVAFIMLAAYIIHYFRLENRVQHWYKIAEQLHDAAQKKENH